MGSRTMAFRQESNEILHPSLLLNRQGADFFFEI